MVELETAAGVSENLPVAVYVGSNFLYGAKNIENNLEQLIQNAKLNNSGFVWIPNENPTSFSQSQNQNQIQKRFQSFSIMVVVFAGLIDGINPCAFATLILFVSLLRCYRSSFLDIFATTTAFALAVFITYFLIGLGAFAGLKNLQSSLFLAKLLDWFMVALCLGLAFFSLRDAWLLKSRKNKTNLALAMPKSLRDLVSLMLRKYAGRRRWLLGVFFVGVVVSLLETVCTGQIYVPTLAFMAKHSDKKTIAISLLALYNFMFIVPLVVLACSVTFGVNSSKMLAWQSKNAIAARFLLAIFFAALAAVMMATILNN